ncbi:MAG: hypothetical protein ACRD40_00825 [Candidatus Acidiferrales bacterium]
MNKKGIRLIFAVISVCAMAMSVWAKKFALTASHAVPAATGTVETHLDKNGNTAVDIKVHHLARPANLTPPATVYIVWFQQSGSEPQKEAELKVSDNLDGELKTTTQWKTFDLIISAESDPAAKLPSDNQVMRTSIRD